MKAKFRVTTILPKTDICGIEIETGSFSSGISGIQNYLQNIGIKLSNGRLYSNKNKSAEIYLVPVLFHNNILIDWVDNNKAAFAKRHGYPIHVKIERI